MKKQAWSSKDLKVTIYKSQDNQGIAPRFALYFVLYLLLPDPTELAGIWQTNALGIFLFFYQSPPVGRAELSLVLD